MRRTLTHRQEAFCQYFAASGNAADAARRAGYSQKAAKEVASRLLTSANICYRVDSIRAERFGAVALDAKSVLRELSVLAAAPLDPADPLAGNRLRAKVQSLVALAKHHGLLDGPKGFAVDQDRINAKLAEIADSIQQADGRGPIDGSLDYHGTE